MPSPRETREVDLPEPIVARVRNRLPETEFESVESYVGYVLEEVLETVEAETGDDEFEPVDEAEIERRLRELGYLE